jgi:hypothetical protein
MSDQPSAHEAQTPEPEAGPSSGGGPASRPEGRRPSPWHSGALFHAAARYPRKRGAPRVDRLTGILRRGLLAPACCPDGSVCSDLNLVVTGTAVPYDSLIFLHLFGPESSIYTISNPGRFTVFVDPAFPVLTPDDMGDHWVILSQDEVYVRDRIAPEALTAVIVHHDDADAVVRDLIADFRRLGIPLYDDEGDVLWEPRANRA